MGSKSVNSSLQLQDNRASAATFASSVSLLSALSKNGKASASSETSSEQVLNTRARSAISVGTRFEEPESYDVDDQANNDSAQDVRAKELKADMQALKERVDNLALPLQLLKKGLSSIGKAPDSPKYVFQRLSLPVSVFL